MGEVNSQNPRVSVTTLNRYLQKLCAQAEKYGGKFFTPRKIKSLFKKLPKRKKYELKRIKLLTYFTLLWFSALTHLVERRRCYLTFNTLCKLVLPPEFQSRDLNFLYRYLDKHYQIEVYRLNAEDRKKIKEKKTDEKTVEKQEILGRKNVDLEDLKYIPRERVAYRFRTELLVQLQPFLPEINKANTKRLSSVTAMTINGLMPTGLSKIDVENLTEAILAGKNVAKFLYEEKKLECLVIEEKLKDKLKNYKRPSRMKKELEKEKGKIESYLRFYKVFKKIEKRGIPMFEKKLEALRRKYYRKRRKMLEILKTNKK